MPESTLTASCFKDHSFIEDLKLFRAKSVCARAPSGHRLHTFYKFPFLQTLPCPVTAEVASPLSAMSVRREQLPLNVSPIPAPIWFRRGCRDFCFEHVLCDKLFSLPAEIQSSAHFELCAVMAAVFSVLNCSL